MLKQYKCLAVWCVKRGWRFCAFAGEEPQVLSSPVCADVSLQLPDQPAGAHVLSLGQRHAARPCLHSLHEVSWQAGHLSHLSGGTPFKSQATWAATLCLWGLALSMLGYNN